MAAKQHRTNVAHRLLYLQNYGEGVLTRLHHARRQSRDKAFPRDSKEYDRVLRKLGELFPKEPRDVDVEKIVGYETFKAHDLKIFEALEPTFMAVQAVAEYRAAVASVLQEAGATATLRREQNPLVVDGVLHVVSYMVAMCALLSEMMHSCDIRTDVCVFAHVHKLREQSAHPHFTAVCDLLLLCEKHHGVRAHPEIVDNHRATVVICVGEAFKEIRTLNDTSMQRTQGLFNPLHMEGYAALPLQCETYLPYLRRSALQQQILHCALACPSVLAQDDGQFAVKSALSNWCVLPVWRDVGLPVHDALDYVVDKADRKVHGLPRRSKLKPLFEEAASAAVSLAFEARRQHRLFLAHEGANLTHMFTDSPGLLCPKAFLVCCCLSNIREEITWVMLHTNAVLPKNARKVQLKKPDTKELPALVHAATELARMLHTHAGAVAVYHAEQLSGMDLTSLKKAREGVSGADQSVVHVIQEIETALEGVNADGVAEGALLDMEPTRRLIYTAQGMLSAPAYNHPKTAEAVVPVFREIMVHTRFVDDLPHVMREWASLGDLVFFPDFVKTVFSECLNGVDEEPACCLSLLRAVDMCAHSLHPHAPLEHLWMQRQCERLAKELMHALHEHLVTTLHDLHLQLYMLDYSSLHPAPHTGRKKPTTNLPGSESDGGLRLRNPLWTWAHRQNVLLRIVSLLDAVKELDVFHVRLRPRELLLKVLDDKIQKVLGSKIPAHGKVLTAPLVQPSQLLAELKALVRTCQIIAEHSPFPFPEVLQRHLLGEVESTRLGAFGMEASVASASKGADDKPNTTRKPLVEVLAEWMLLFVKTDMERNVVFSSWHDGMITTAHMAEHVGEQYFSACELRALVTIVGPGGVLGLDHSICQRIRDHVHNIGKFLKENASSLEAFQNKYASSKDIFTECKRLRDKGGKDFEFHLLSVGKLVSLRRVLYESLHANLGELSPLEVSLTELTHGCFVPTQPLKAAAVMKLMPYVVRTAGTGASDADLPLRQFLRDEDPTVWQLLPVAAASTCFGSWMWTTPSYNTATAAFATNAHLLARALATLVAAFAPDVPARAFQNPQGVPDAEGKGLKTFVEVGTVVVLRMRERDDLAREFCIPDMIILLDKVASECRALQSVRLDHALPYTLVCAAYLDAHNRSRAQEGIVEEAQQEAATLPV